MSNTGHMDQERLEELKAARALGALGGEESKELDEHLAERPEQQAEVNELGAVAEMLALSTEEREPPESLRTNLLSAVGTEQEGDGRQEAAQESGGWRRWIPGFREAALGAAVVALVALLAWNLLLQNNLQDLRAETKSPKVYAVQSTGSSSNASGELLAYNSERATLIVKNMNQLSEGKVCQIWVIEGGAPKAAGTFNPEKGPVASPVRLPIKGADTVAVTIEPKGGSEQPTSDPVLATKLGGTT